MDNGDPSPEQEMPARTPYDPGAHDGYWSKPTLSNWYANLGLGGHLICLGSLMIAGNLAALLSGLHWTPLYPLGGITLFIGLCIACRTSVFSLILFYALLAVLGVLVTLCKPYQEFMGPYSEPLSAGLLTLIFFWFFYRSYRKANRSSW